MDPVLESNFEPCLDPGLDRSSTSPNFDPRAPSLDSLSVSNFDPPASNLELASSASNTEPVRDACFESNLDPTPESKADVVSPSSEGGAETDESSRETGESRLDPAVLKVDPGAETPVESLELLEEEADFFWIDLAESINLVGEGGGEGGGGGGGGVGVEGGGVDATVDLIGTAVGGDVGGNEGGVAGSGFLTAFTSALLQQPPIFMSLLP